MTAGEFGAVRSTKGPLPLAVPSGLDALSCGTWVPAGVVTVSSGPPGAKVAVPMDRTVVPLSTSRLARVRPPTVMLTVCELAPGAVAVAVTGMWSCCGVADEHAASSAAAPPATAAAPHAPSRVPPAERLVPATATSRDYRPAPLAS